MAAPAATTTTPNGAIVDPPVNARTLRRAAPLSALSATGEMVEGIVDDGPVDDGPVDDGPVDDGAASFVSIAATAGVRRSTDAVDVEWPSSCVAVVAATVNDSGWQTQHLWMRPATAAASEKNTLLAAWR